jgi:hypothetical protein
VIDILVQPHGNQRAAERFFRKLLHGQGSEPLRIITDQLKLLCCDVKHLQQRDSQCGALRQQSSRSLASADAPTRAAKQGRRQEPCSTPDHLPSLSKCLRFPAAVLLRSAIQMGNSKTTLRPGSKRRFKRISYFGPTVFKAAHDSACVDVCSGTCLNIERSFWVAVWWRDTLPRSLWSMA